MKYAVVLPVVGVFMALAIFAGHSQYIWPIVAAWLVCGYVWFHLWGPHWTIWWTRIRLANRLADRFLVVGVVAFVTLYCMAWPVWALAGEDVF